MPASPLMLHQLLAPQYLLGLTLPEFLDRLPNFLLIEELRSVYDDTAVVYLGTAMFTGDGDAAPVLELAPGDGSVFDWRDFQVQFRLILPRDGASQINTAVGVLANPPVNNPTLRNLLDEFGPVEQNPAQGVFTEYPGFAYRLELLVSTLTFHLSKEKWKPGKVENGRIVPDPDLVGKEDVRFILPKMLFELTQPDDPTAAPEFRLKSWGNSGFDARTSPENIGRTIAQRVWIGCAA